MLFDILGGDGSKTRGRSYSAKCACEDPQMIHLADMRRELADLLIPILRENVKTWKENPSTNWVISTQGLDSRSDAVREAVELYVHISTFLIAIQATREFTRYLKVPVQIPNGQRKNNNLTGGCEFHDTDRLRERARATTSNLDKLLSEKHVITSKYPSEYNARNRFGNTIWERVRDPTN